MKVYISLPITGKENTIKERLESALTELKAFKPEAEPVLPKDLLKIGTTEHDETKSLGYWLGQDIEILMQADAILMCKGWYSSKGCLLEKECARLYDKQIYYQV